MGAWLTRARAPTRWSFLVSSCLLLLMACSGLGTEGAATKARPQAKPPLPVVAPFDISRAGSSVSANFTVPNERTNGNSLRSVFIGVRAIQPRVDVDSEAFKQASGQGDYMEREPLPIRIKVWRLDGGQHQAMALRRRGDDRLNAPTQYVDVVEDIVPRLCTVNADWEALYAVGLDVDEETAERDYEIVRIKDLVPGTYRVDAESLASHPILSPIRFELLVSHDYRY